jgi:NitT/TauT family transport system substrate-binding protein
MFGKAIRATKASRRLLATGGLLAWLAIMPAGNPVLGAETVRIAVLKFGTASWELDTVRHHGLDREQGIRVDVLALAGKQAAMVALQGGEADIALNDWLWVSRQRGEGRAFTFAPYSTAAGGLVVPEGSPIGSLQDLAGKRVGIAGGPLDKNWLLFRALTLEADGKDLAETAVPVFAAPPLLNQQLKQGRIDAAINFWPYVARLTTEGMHRLIGTREATESLGIETVVPLVGYVFDEDWARAHPQAIAAFLRATAKARELLAGSDEEWQRLRAMMRAPDEATFLALRDGYRAGIPQPLGEAERADAARLFAILAQLGGKDLVGDASELSPGTFWNGADD